MDEVYQNNVHLIVQESDAVHSTHAETSNLTKGYKVSITLLCGGTIVCGIISIFEFDLPCILSGILTCFLAVTFLGLELHARWPWLLKLGMFLDHRPKWQAGALFSMFSLLPVFLCTWTWSIVSFLLMLIAGISCAVLGCIENDGTDIGFTGRDSAYMAFQDIDRLFSTSNDKDAVTPMTPNNEFTLSDDASPVENNDGANFY